MAFSRRGFLAGLFCAPLLGATRAGRLLAPTPPMGWMSWNGFGKRINERLIHEMADAMVSTGLRDKGYRYVCLDDFWCVSRDRNGNLIGDPKKFPSGMKALATYLHERGLKLGVYSDAGLQTCGGNPGSYGNERRDADTLASWGVDYLKYDYCGAPPDRATAIRRYSAMEEGLRATGRPIVFAVCEWGGRQPWLWAARIGAQEWRATGDIRDTWEKPKDAGSWLVGVDDDIHEQLGLNRYAAPGHWNDMDQLVVGLYGHVAYGPPYKRPLVPCTNVEYRTQMSFWSMLAAPLMITCDLRTADATVLEMLGNPDVLAVDQDHLGREAWRAVHDGPTEVWMRPLANGDTAAALFNNGESAREIEVSWWQLKLGERQHVRDLWKRSDLGVVASGYMTRVEPHETVLLRLRPSA